MKKNLIGSMNKFWGSLPAKFTAFFLMLESEILILYRLIYISFYTVLTE